MSALFFVKEYILLRTLDKITFVKMHNILSHTGAKVQSLNYFLIGNHWESKAKPTNSEPICTVQVKCKLNYAI